MLISILVGHQMLMKIAGIIAYFLPMKFFLSGKTNSFVIFTTIDLKVCPNATGFFQSLALPFCLVMLSWVLSCL